MFLGFYQLLMVPQYMEVKKWFRIEALFTQLTYKTILFVVLVMVVQHFLCNLLQILVAGLTKYCHSDFHFLTFNLSAEDILWNWKYAWISNFDSFYFLHFMKLIDKLLTVQYCCISNKSFICVCGVLLYCSGYHYSS